MIYNSLSDVMAVYEGEWVDGKQEGDGVLTFKDGSKLKGDYLGGKPHGDMTLVHPNGVLNKLLTYKNGKIVESESDSELSSDSVSDEDNDSNEDEKDEVDEEESNVTHDKEEVKVDEEESDLVEGEEGSDTMSMSITETPRTDEKDKLIS